MKLRQHVWDDLLCREGKTNERQLDFEVVKVKNIVESKEGLQAYTMTGKQLMCAVYRYPDRVEYEGAYVWNRRGS